jgi:uncharacterized repeat protein (TIGR02543 family)
MAITNLTGTKWEFNNNPGVFNDFGFPVGTFNINFLSNDNNYTSITGSYDFNGDYSYIQYNSTTVYNGTWTNSNYRVIEITGGTDVEDETLIAWLEANATQIIEPSGYTISFNSNGGTTISDIEEATELPTPLPTPTKSGYTFVAWYYESNFQTRAVAGDTLESNVTLYAKWHNLGSLFTEIADAIRSKDGTSENIRDVDFGDRIRVLDTCIYLTQEEYDLLDPPNENITYIIVEVE